MKAGFVLPVAVLLVLVLTVSGTSFLQHDYLERRMVTNEVDNHAAFYLASAGLERARASFEIPEGDPPSWTPLLVTTTEYDPILCPEDGVTPPKGCLEPPFGGMIQPNDIPFAEDFDVGAYLVRATNDANDIDADGSGPDVDEDGDDIGTNDTDATITLHALGSIRGEVKLLRVDVRAIHGLKLINCGYANREVDQQEEKCPQVHEGADPVELTHLAGKSPEFFPAADLPMFQAGFYQNHLNFSWIQNRVNLPPPTGQYVDIENIQSNTYYYGSMSDPANGIRIPLNSSATGVVVFSEGTIKVGLGANLENSILIGLGGVIIEQGQSTPQGFVPTISAPPQALGYFPAIISGGLVGIDQDAIDIKLEMNIVGSIYAQRGFIQLRQGVEAEGLITARESLYDNVDTGPKNGVQLRQRVKVTDGGKLSYYGRMRGFEYPGKSIVNAVVTGKWREVE